MFNVVNPDKICEEYGADTLRLYEMFLGPVEMSKPWDTKGIDGVNRFLKKFWRLFFQEPNANASDSKFYLTDDEPTAEELKILHKLINKVETDIEAFSFNTSVSSFMIAVNELSALKCTKRSVLVPIVILLSPFAPHICEELWNLSGEKMSISYASFPKYEEKYTTESTFEYPVSFNGKMRFKISLPKELSEDMAKEAILKSEEAVKWMEGKEIKRLIVVPGRIINIVI